MYVCVHVVWYVGGLSKILSAKASRLHSLVAAGGIDTVMQWCRSDWGEGRKEPTIIP